MNSNNVFFFRELEKQYARVICKYSPPPPPPPPPLSPLTNLIKKKKKKKKAKMFVILFFFSQISEDDMPKTLFCFEFEDKDGKIYKQYVKEVSSLLVLFEIFPNSSQMC